MNRLTLLTSRKLDSSKGTGLLILVGLAICVTLFGSSGCISKNKLAVQRSDIEEKATKELEKALSLMSSEKYHDAEGVLEKILVTTPATEFDFVVMYNLGSAKEGQKDCRGASEVYRQIVRGSNKKFPRMEAVSLLRLGYTYECLGLTDKVIVALLDARSRSQQLPEDVVKAELPARLAAAYAKSGNRAEAEKYFRQALLGVKFLQVKYRDSKVMADTLSENLYFMGRNNVSDQEFYRNPSAQMRGLELSQLYLLQAAELGSAKWSARAVDEILNSYQKVMKWAENLPAPNESDPHIRKRGLQEGRADLLKETLRSLRILRTQRIPSRQESSDVSRLFNLVEDQERKVSSWLAELGVSNELTSESEKRQSLKGAGRTQSSEKSSLEIEAERRAKVPATVPAKRGK